MKNQTKTTEDTRKAFVDAFCTFYKNKPVEKITIQEITNKAGYNRSTFYQYFKDVYDLLTYLEDMVISYARDKVVTNIVINDINDTFIASFKDIKEEMGLYMDVLLANINNTKFAERLKIELFPIFMEQFQISETDVELKYMLEFYLSGLIAISKRWMQSDWDISMEKLGRLLNSFLNKGLRTTLEKNIQPHGE